MPEDANQEARLKRIIQKQEVKLKSIWDENKKLTQSLELAQLDYEIANEQSQSLQDELKTVQARIRELEELRNLSDELEASYVSENSQLQQQCESLRSQLDSAGSSVQSLESIRLELRNAQRLLKVSELEISVIKNGVVAALGPLLAPSFPDTDFLHLIDHLHLEIDSIFGQYRVGDISITVLGQKLSDYVEESLQNPKTIQSAVLPSEGDPHLARLVEAKNRIFPPQITNLEESNEVEEKDKLTETQPEQTKTYKLRISVLESKLEQAESVSLELEKLQNSHRASLESEKQLKNQIKDFVHLLEQKEGEITSLKKKSLPTELLIAQHASKVVSLNNAIKFLTAAKPAFELPNLEIVPPKPVSKFVRNQNIRKFRDQLLSLEVGTSKESCRDLALDQRMRMTFL